MRLPSVAASDTSLLTFTLHRVLRPWLPCLLFLTLLRCYTLLTHCLLRLSCPCLLHCDQLAMHADVGPDSFQPSATVDAVRRVHRVSVSALRRCRRGSPRDAMLRACGPPEVCSETAPATKLLQALCKVSNRGHLPALPRTHALDRHVCLSALPLTRHVLLWSCQHSVSKPRWTK